MLSSTIGCSRGMRAWGEVRPAFGQAAGRTCDDTRNDAHHKTPKNDAKWCAMVRASVGCTADAT